MQKEKSVYQKQDYNHRDGERGVALFVHSLQTTENLFKMAFFATVKNDLYVNFLSKHFETFQTWTNLDSVLYSFKFTAFFSTSREMMMMMMMMMTTTTKKKRCALFRGIALYHVLEDSVCSAHFVGRLYIFFSSSRIKKSEETRRC